MKCFSKLVALGAFLFTVTLPLAAQADVILHAFEWSYQSIEQNADEIAAAGYKAVLVVPPLKNTRTDCAWYQHYQPQDFRVVDHCKGNKEDLERMIGALSSRGVRVYADVVVNHMANERNHATTFPGDEALNQYSMDPTYWNRQRLFGDLSVGLFSPQDFHSNGCIATYTDPDQVLNGRICGAFPDRGLPDLNNSDWVNDQRRNYIQALFDLGIRGFRIDAAKHMPTRTIRSIIPDTIANQSQVFAEIITWGGTTDPEYNLYLKPYLEQLPAAFGAYDFPLLNALKRGFQIDAPLSDLANPYGTGNALEWNRAVTVAVTHDIPYNSTFQSLVLDPKDEELSYAYILGRDGGTPMVFDDRSDLQWYDGRWGNAWRNESLRRMIGFHNRMQGKPMEVLHADRCSLLWRRAEDGIVAINKCGETQRISIDTNRKLKWFVPYREALTHGTPLEITSGNYVFEVPGRSARMWYAE
jgi:alpha-amylase